jgi:Ca2+-binding EF-hand superfamily protein
MSRLDIQEFFVAVKMQQQRRSAVFQSTRHNVQASRSRDVVANKLLTDDEIVALFRLIDSHGDGLVTTQMVTAFLDGGTSGQTVEASATDSTKTDTCKLGLEAFSQAVRSLALSSSDLIADGEVEALFAAIDSGGSGCISAQDFTAFLGGASLRSALDKLQVHPSGAQNSPRSNRSN